MFMYAGKKHGFSLDTTNKSTAEALKGGVERTLTLLGQSVLTVLDGADVAAFVRAGGKAVEPPKPAPEAVTFARLRDRYLETHSNGAMEASSLLTLRIHLKHLGETLGERFAVRRLTLADVQRHIDRRAAAKFRGRKIGPVTIKKEVTTLRAVWNWGRRPSWSRGPSP